VILTPCLLWQPLDQCPIEAQAVNLTEGISSGEHELCIQENLTGNHNSVLPTIYISCPWSILQLLYAYSNVHTLSSCPLLIHHVSTSRPACHIHVPWHHTLNPTLNLHHPYMHHVYTMRNYVSWCHSFSRLFLILLDPKFFQTTLDYSRPYNIMLCDFPVMCLLSLIID